MAAKHERWRRDISIMTSLGHTLVAGSVALWCMPVISGTIQRGLFIVAMIAIASLPDWPIPGWGHSRLYLSHSILINTGIIAGILVSIRLMAPLSFQKYRMVAVGVVVAWLSHFLLDTLYDNSSLAMFWPLSNAGVSLPLPWLKTMPHVPPPFDDRILKIFILEAVTFFPLLVLAVFLRLRR